MENQKTPDKIPQQHEHSINNLPKPWAIAVQLIGTFGLAVFLVLFQVFHVTPQEKDRIDSINEKFMEKYDKLLTTINNLDNTTDELNQILEERKPFLTADRVRCLESLYIAAVTTDLVPIIQAELVELDDIRKNEYTSQQMKEISDKLSNMIFIKMKERAETIDIMLQELYHTNFSAYKKITGDPNGVFKSIAEDAIGGWNKTEFEYVANNVKTALQGSLWGLNSL